MKKLVFVIGLLIIMILGGCGSKQAIKNGEFTFSEDEFKEIYEEINDKNFPTDILFRSHAITSYSDDEEGAIELLNAFYKATGYKEVRWLKESIEKEDSNAPTLIQTDDVIVSYDKLNHSVDVLVIGE